MKNIKIVSIILALIISINISAQELKQTIKGLIIDKETEIPLTGATVIIKGSHPLVGTTTDMNGYFKFEDLQLGRYHFIIAYIGYAESSVGNILLTSGKEVFLHIKLQENAVNLETAVVSASNKNESINEMASISARTFSVEETGRYAGSRADPARMASNYAGVVGGGDMRNDIIVRGNAPFGILWRMEGLEIPNPNHYSFAGTSGGLFSMLNNNLLSNSDFLTGAFPAEYGNKTAAVFDLKMRNGNSDQREHVAQIGLNGLEFGTEGGFSRNNRSSYLVNYRMFSLKPAKKIGINFKTSGIPNFQDFSFKLNIPTKKYGTINIFGLGGTSNLSILDSERSAEDWDAANNDDITFGSNTGFVGLTHAYIFNKNAYGKFSYLMAGTKVSVFREFVFLDEPSVLQEDLQMKNTYQTFKYEYHQKISPKHFIKAGISYQPKQNELFQKQMDNVDTALYHINFDTKAKTALTQSYISWKYRPTNKVTINSGLHAQYLTLNKTYAIEPRLGLNYQIDDQKKIALGYGLHSQMLPMIYYTRNFYDSNGNIHQTNKNLDFSKSHHFIAGYNQSFSNNTRIKVEAYYQRLFNIPVSKEIPFYSTVSQGADFSFWVPDSLKNTGTGKNYGLEMTFEKFFTKNYYFLVTASLFESKFTGGTGKEYHSPLSLGYVGNALLGYELPVGKHKTNAFIFDFKTTIMGGKRYIPIDLNRSIDTKAEVLDTEKAYETKYKDFLKTDIKISYRSNRKNATHFVFIAVDNVFNNQNILLSNYNEETQDINKTFQLGVFPYFGYRLQF